MKMTERDFMGKEPEFPYGSMLTSPQITKCHNWYSYFMDDKPFGMLIDPKVFTLEYLWENKEDETAKELNCFPQWKFSAIGWLARLMSRGYLLPPESMKFFRDKIAMLREEYKTVDKSVVIPHIRKEKSRNILNELDERIDAFWEEREILSTSDWLKDIPTFEIKKVIARCEVLLEETKSLKKRKDSKFLDTLMDEAQEVLKSKLANRKPRAKKNK